MTLNVTIMEVGGNTVVKDVTKWAEEGEWETAMDKEGNLARVTLTNCQETTLLQLHPWFHELHIYVDGMPAFVGPILFPAMPNRLDERPTIVAQDMSAWFTVRFMHDILNYTQTGNGFAPTSMVISSFIRSAMRPLDPNLLNFLEVIYNPVLHSREVLNIWPPSEELWGAHLQSMVGTVTHMGVHGRRISFWPINETLRTLPPAAAENFINFPNSVRDGDLFTTRSVVKGRDTVALLTADAPAGDNILSGSFKEAGFFIGQQVSVNTTGVTLPLNTTIVDITDADITISNLMNEDVSSGARVHGTVYGADGGPHPTWPILVERASTDDTLVGTQTALMAARQKLTTESPFAGFGNTFKAEVTCDTPWNFGTIAPGMGVAISTQFGVMDLQVESTSGSWDDKGLKLFVSLKSPGPPVSVEVPIVEPPYTGIRKQSTTRELPMFSIAGPVALGKSPEYPTQSGRDLVEMAVTIGDIGPGDEIVFTIIVNGTVRGEYKADQIGLTEYTIEVPVNRGDKVAIEITDIGLGTLENLLIALRAVR